MGLCPGTFLRQTDWRQDKRQELWLEQRDFWKSLIGGATLGTTMLGLLTRWQYGPEHGHPRTWIIREGGRKRGCNSGFLEKWGGAGGA